MVELLLDELFGAAVATAHAATLDAAVASVTASGADVALLDLSLPDAFGLEAVDRFRAAHPAVAVIVLSGRDDPGLKAELADRGIALVRKGDELERLGPAVRAALRPA